MMASAAHVRDKPITDHHQQQQQQRQPVLKCPRCDSSNTKFCYYNNYSLSQPRHFCKSCKRYWTRGGTLRNVPVGGGCRKNKRSISKSTPFTKPPLGVGAHTTASTPNPNLDHHNPNPLSGLLLSQQQNHKYPRLNNRVSDVSNISRYDIDLIQPAQVSSFGLGFSLSDSGVSNNHGGNHNSIHPIVSTYPSMFSGGLTSSLQQPESIMGFETYGDGGGLVMNDVQIEGSTKSNIVWNNGFNGQNDNENENDQIKGTDHQSSDPASFLWSLTGGDGGEWLDPTTTICSSLL